MIVGIKESGKDAIEDEKTEYKEAKKKDYKAQFILRQCVDPVHFEKISVASTAKEAWDILEKTYAGADKTKKVKLQALRRQYELMEMENRDEVAAFFNWVTTLTNQMKNCGEILTNQ